MNIQGKKMWFENIFNLTKIPERSAMVHFSQNQLRVRNKVTSVQEVTRKPIHFDPQWKEWTKQMVKLVSPRHSIKGLRYWGKGRWLAHFTVTVNFCLPTIHIIIKEAVLGWLFCVR